MNLAPPAPDADVPEGFRLIEQGGPYFSALGPAYARMQPDGGAVIGLRVRAQHTNMLGMTHGGMLATVADSALGMNVALLRKPRQSLVTVSLSVDYLSAAMPGDWLEAHVTVRRQGRQLAFAECLLQVGERVMLRASGVFSVTSRERSAG